MKGTPPREAEIGWHAIQIQDDFWTPRLAMNAAQAIWYQWDQLERSGCIDNFRICAGAKEGTRWGRFYADSDAYKWLEAACWISLQAPSPLLQGKIDELVSILCQAQQEDGYLYTYNQHFFPGQRWVVLQIEHELYCLGHLLEAGIAHNVVFQSEKLLDIAIRAADLCVKTFAGATQAWPDGHPEIELALLKLAGWTGNPDYERLAQRFLEGRGRDHHFTSHFLRAGIRFGRRAARTIKLQKQYCANHPAYVPPVVPKEVYKKHTFWQKLRMLHVLLSGKFFQQHAPFRAMIDPEGHAVMFQYLMVGWALLFQRTGDAAILAQLEHLWDKIVTRRMYLTGGVGNLSSIEGFGYDYELPNSTGYGETCAGLAGVFWSWEMLKATGRACYADVLERQLYNAALAGIAADGRSYLYRNPLEADVHLKREPWFGTPCCPSNLSRTWGVLAKYCYTTAPGTLSIHQYVGNKMDATIPPAEEAGETQNPVVVAIAVQSALPWEGSVTVKVDPQQATKFTIRVRIPHWALEHVIAINGEEVPKNPSLRPAPRECASGFSPYTSHYVPLQRRWQPGDTILLQFPMNPTLHRAPAKVAANRGRVALSRGPVVYCVESVDNDQVDFATDQIDLSRPLEVQTHAQPASPVLRRVPVIQGWWVSGAPLTAIPYFLWANRGPSNMQVWLRDRVKK